MEKLGGTEKGLVLWRKGGFHYEKGVCKRNGCSLHAGSVLVARKSICCSHYFYIRYGCQLWKWGTIVGWRSSGAGRLF